MNHFNNEMKYNIERWWFQNVFKNNKSYKLNFKCITNELDQRLLVILNTMVRYQQMVYK